jgi:hypothetical protein
MDLEVLQKNLEAVLYFLMVGEVCSRTEEAKYT